MVTDRSTPHPPPRRVTASPDITCHARAVQSEGVSARRRVLVSITPGVVGGAVVGVLTRQPLVAALTGWDVAAAVFLAWTWRVVWPLDGPASARRAEREDPTQPMADLLLLVAAPASLAGAPGGGGGGPAPADGRPAPARRRQGRPGGCGRRALPRAFRLRPGARERPGPGGGVRRPLVGRRAHGLRPKVRPPLLRGPR